MCALVQEICDPVTELVTEYLQSLFFILFMYAVPPIMMRLLAVKAGSKVYVTQAGPHFCCPLIIN